MLCTSWLHRTPNNNHHRQSYAWYFDISGLQKDVVLPRWSQLHSQPPWALVWSHLLLNQPRQECQTKQDKIKFPGWHQSLDVFTTYRRWINLHHIQMSTGGKLHAAAGSLHYYNQLSFSITHSFTIVNSNTRNTFSHVKQSKAKGFHMHPVENSSYKHISQVCITYLLGIQTTNPLQQNKPLSVAQHSTGTWMGQFWTRCLFKGICRFSTTPTCHFDFTSSSSSPKHTSHISHSNQVSSKQSTQQALCHWLLHRVLIGNCYTMLREGQTRTFPCFRTDFAEGFYLSCSFSWMQTKLLGSSPPGLAVGTSVPTGTARSLAPPALFTSPAPLLSCLNISIHNHQPLFTYEPEQMVLPVPESLVLAFLPNHQPGAVGWTVLLFYHWADFLW